MKPQGHCPYTKIVKRDKGDFVTEGKITHFVIERTWEEEVPCIERGYDIIDNAPFQLDSGFEPGLVLVKCKGCGQNYFVYLRTPPDILNSP